MVRAGPLAAAMAGLALFGALSANAADPACFWVHGRLTAANGAPTFRIAWLGTRRVLGVADDRLPETVQRRVQPDAFKVEVVGDFRVCPLAADRPGRMRPVRLTDARRLVVRRAHPYAPAD